MRTLFLRLSLILSFCIAPLFSQETCESEEKLIDDLNSITKCSVEKTEKANSKGIKTKKLSVKISSSVRYLKRRTNKEVSGLGDINTSGVEATKVKSELETGLDLSTINNIKKLKEKLSKEQLSSSFEFDQVDHVPSFKKCESVKKSEGINCFNEQMILHIQEFFRYPQEAVMKKVQGNVWVRFVIDEEGNVTNLKTLAPRNGVLLKQEAERVVSKLPSFKPATKNGKNVLVKYGFPINFSLEE